MADPASLLDEVPEPDISHLVIEDDEPVDNLYSGLQQALLSDALYSSWQTDREFVALVNVGLFYALQKPPYVPDFMLSLDVSLPKSLREKKNKTYLMWEYGKRPDLVLEVVSNIDRHEERKLKGYADIGIPYYVIYDPEHHLSERTLRAYVLHGSAYVELVKPFFDEIGLGLAFWDGDYHGGEDTWLRWIDRDENLLLTGAEKAEAAEQKSQRLEARLRELGIDPDG